MSWIKRGIPECLFLGLLIHAIAPAVPYVNSGTAAVLIAIVLAAALRIVSGVIFASQKANIMTLVISSGLGIFLADACLLLFRTELFQAHELASIPPKVSVKSDYVLTKQTPDWTRVVVEEGQAAQYVGQGLFPSAENIVTTDANGYRNPANPNNASDSRTIILGDSYAFGYGVSDEETISSRLNEEDVSVYNLGVYGVSVGNGVELLFHEQATGLIAEKLEHIVVFVYEGNDLTDRNVYTSKDTLSGSRLGQYFTLLREYSTLNLIVHAIKSGLIKKGEDASPYLLLDSQSVGNIALLKKDFLRTSRLNADYETAKQKFALSDIPEALSKLVSSETEAKVVLVYIPIKARLLSAADKVRLLSSSEEFAKYGVSDANWVLNVTTEFARNHGIATIDVESLCAAALERPLDCFLKGDTHLSPLGLNLVKNELLPFLVRPAER